MLNFAQLVFLAALAYLPWVWTSRRKRNPKGLPYPPGPPRLPLVGNLFDLASDKPWLRAEELGKKYGTFHPPFSNVGLDFCLLGDLIYLEVVGTPFLFINSCEMTNDLLEHRSLNYSDRPNSPMVNDLCVMNMISIPRSD